MVEFKTLHQRRVEEFLVGIGRQVPAVPQLPDKELAKTWCRLLLEEVLELFQASGIALGVHNQGYLDLADFEFQEIESEEPDLPAIADACADISVVNTGFMSICGIADGPILQEVDENNLLKTDPSRGGYLCSDTGKFIKPANHPKPDFGKCLVDQGWSQEVVSL